MKRKDIPYGRSIWWVWGVKSCAGCVFLVPLAGLAFALTGVLGASFPQVAVVMSLSIVAIILFHIYQAIGHLCAAIRYPDMARIYMAVMQFIDDVDWENAIVPAGSTERLRERTRDTAFVYDEITARFVQELKAFTWRISDFGIHLHEHGLLLRELWLAKSKDSEDGVSHKSILSQTRKDYSRYLLSYESVQSDELDSIIAEAAAIESEYDLSERLKLYRYAEWKWWALRPKQHSDWVPVPLYADLFKLLPEKWISFLESGPEIEASDMFGSCLQGEFIHNDTGFRRDRARDRIVTSILYPDSEARSD